ncbi:hypothetical protein [Aquimarina sp. I32.4]|uniref:hypothetical protein n=1 Tax=Aquimarina sp. I32.4 TaxID=2053903 RepID=UPI000CDEE96A|nr:hypothetical protein [Aquimarina sp. I32.4]
MKKNIILLLLSIITIPNIMACDICGCQLSGLSFGLLAGTNTHYIGLRYTQAAFSASIKYNSNLLQDEYSSDTFIRTELLGRYILSNKLQLHAIVPYINNDMNGSMQSLQFNGIGDPSLLLFYNVLEKKESKKEEVAAPSTNAIKQTLLIGGGLKFPTGKFDRSDRGEIVNRNFQVGTGSFDFLLSSNYTVSMGRWGLNAEASYKINTRNSDEYLFGNQFNTSGYLFYTIPIKNGVISPFTGTLFEAADKHDDGIQKFNTGGNATLGTVGMQVNWKSFSLNTLVQSPLQQNYNSDAISTIETDTRFSIGLLYHFAKKKKRKYSFN